VARLEVSKDELEAISLESTRTIDISEFVPRQEIDDLYLVRPYYIVPDGMVGHDAYAVIRKTIRTMDKVALVRVVLTSREHVIALAARDKGLIGMLLRYPYEVRSSTEYFDDIQDVKITKEMLDLAKHAILIHGVSLSLRGSGRLDIRLDTPPISCRHHPVSRIAPVMVQSSAFNSRSNRSYKSGSSGETIRPRPAAQALTMLQQKATGFD